MLIIQTTTATETDISKLTNEINNTDGLQSSESSESSTSSTSSSEILIPTNLPNPPLSPLKYTMQDNEILGGVMPILFKQIPLLTVSVFERYEKTSQFKLAEAEYATMYEITKRSQMCNEVSKLLDNEQSVKATIIKSVISDEVQSELAKMRNQVKNNQRKIDEANKNLASLKTLNSSSKDRAVSKFVKTAANTELNRNLNRNPKEKEKNLKFNPHHHETHLNSTSTPTSKKTILYSKSNSNSNEKKR